MRLLPAFGGMRPAPILARVAARAVDLSLMGAVFIALSMAIVLVVRIGHGLVAWGADTGEIGWRDLREAWHLFAFALVVAFSYEPASLAGRGTRGKIAANLELRGARQPDRLVTPRRAIGRYVMSVGVCGISVGLAFAVALVVGMDLTPWRVVGLVALPSTVVWASVLVSALFRADRRGWHDLAAGTVLVSVSVPPPRRRTAGRDRK